MHRNRPRLATQELKFTIHKKINQLSSCLWELSSYNKFLLQVNQGAIETTADETTANATSSIAQEPDLSQREETTLEDEATLDQVISH